MSCGARRGPHFDVVKGENHDEHAKLSARLGQSRIRNVIAHYESQTEDEQFAEIEAALEGENVTLMAVPTELVPEIRAILAKNRGD